MQGSDVAESQQPLRMFTKGGEVNLVHQMHGPVSSSAAKNSFHFRIIHRTLQVLQTLPDRSGITSGRTSGIFKTAVAFLASKVSVNEENEAMTDFLELLKKYFNQSA